jgi:hypothetical protein
MYETFVIGMISSLAGGWIFNHFFVGLGLFVPDSLEFGIATLLRLYMTAELKESYSVLALEVLFLYAKYIACIREVLHLYIKVWPIEEHSSQSIYQYSLLFFIVILFYRSSLLSFSLSCPSSSRVWLIFAALC